MATIPLLRPASGRARRRRSWQRALPDGVARHRDVCAPGWAASIPALLDPSVRIAVNAELGHGNAPIADGDEIAFLPPMSGG